MARNNFAACMVEEFAHEGGYVDHPNDPGGATNMGVTIATLSAARGRRVTKAEVKALTKAEATEIYRTRIWNVVRGDDLPHGVDFVTFDPAVNSGSVRGVKWLQTALGAPADGKMGPMTLAAVAAADAVAVIKRACDLRMGFLRGLRTWGSFGTGWSRRVARVEAVAIRMFAEAAGKPARPVLIEAKEEAGQKASRAGQAAAAQTAAGGGGITLADIPPWALGVAAALLVLVIFNQIGRRRHQLARAEAMQQVAQEAKA